jgi:K+-transporting ATPase ATPase C chain
MNRLLYNLRASICMLLVMTLFLGVIYPLVVTAFSQGLFAYRANGSLIEWGGDSRGSALLGQQFESPKYFWGRLSATTPPYNPAASAGSNYSPTSPQLLDAANARIAALQKADPANKDPVPVDLVTSSGSGLDPHISLESARYQLARVARARGMKTGEVEMLLARVTNPPLLGLFGHAHVNVVHLNLLLDEK